MPYFTLTYQVVPDYLERRAPLRKRHLAHVSGFRESGQLVLAGAYEDIRDGALLIFDAPNEETVAAFAKTDPYVEAGLVTEWVVRRWMVV